MRCHNEGISGIPLRAARGPRRLFSLEQRIEIVEAVYKGPTESGYEASAWTYMDLWRHPRKNTG